MNLQLILSLSLKQMNMSSAMTALRLLTNSAVKLATVLSAAGPGLLTLTGFSTVSALALAADLVLSQPSLTSRSLLALTEIHKLAKEASSQQHSPCRQIYEQHTIFVD